MDYVYVRIFGRLVCVILLLSTNLQEEIMGAIDLTLVVFAVVIILVQWRMNLLEKKVDILIKTLGDKNE